MIGGKKKVTHLSYVDCTSTNFSAIELSNCIFNVFSTSKFNHTLVVGCLTDELLRKNDVMNLEFSTFMEDIGENNIADLSESVLEILPAHLSRQIIN